jgi:hypothetical protein
VGDGMTLARACAGEGMPRAGEVLEWAEENAEFAARLAAAQRSSARLLFEELTAAVGEPPEGLVPTSFPQWLGWQRLRFTVERMLYSIYDPETFGRIRGPRISTCAEPRPKPQPQPAVIEPAAAEPAAADAAAEVGSAAMGGQCAARNVRHDLAAILLNIAEDESAVEASGSADEVVTGAPDAEGRVIPFTPAAQPVRLSRRHRRAMAARARKAPAARATSPPS